MKYIRTNAVIGDNDPNEFAKALTEAIDNMQNRGFEVEMQFNTVPLKDGSVYFSAVLLGRDPE